MADPLPDLGSTDFGGGRIFHEIVDGRCAATGQPGGEVAKADVHVGLEAGPGDLAAGFIDGEQVVAGDPDVGSLTINLVEALAQNGVELDFGHRDQVGVGHPRTVATVVCFAPLVFLHLGEGLGGDLGVTTVGNEGRHPANGVGAPLVAGGHHELGVGTHERRRHGDIGPVG